MMDSLKNGTLGSKQLYRHDGINPDQVLEEGEDNLLKL